MCKYEIVGWFSVQFSSVQFSSCIVLGSIGMIWVCWICGWMIWVRVVSVDTVGIGNSGIGIGAECEECVVI
jgi:hypothetical protein